MSGPCDAGGEGRIPDWTPPDAVRDALGFAIDELCRVYELRNGRTALYWHLVGVLGQHVGPRVAEQKGRADG